MLCTQREKRSLSRAQLWRSNDGRKKDFGENEQQGTSMGRGDADDWKMERGTRKHDWGTKRSSSVGGTDAPSAVTGESVSWAEGCAGTFLSGTLHSCLDGSPSARVRFQLGPHLD